MNITVTEWLTPRMVPVELSVSEMMKQVVAMFGAQLHPVGTELDGLLQIIQSTAF